MGPPTVCEQCAKRLKVFKRRKCTHCHAPLCRKCVAPHVAARHPNVASLGSSSNLVESAGSSYADDDDDVHFQSPHARGGDGFSSSGNEAAVAGGASKRRVAVESSVDLLDDLDDVVDVEEEEDEEDGQEEDLLLGEYSRRASMEEEETQFREFTQLQHAVDRWTRKELELKKQQTRAKQNELVYATKPVSNFGSTREHQQRELFFVSYAVFVTLVVWGAYGLVLMLARRAVQRTLA